MANKGRRSKGKPAAARSRTPAAARSRTPAAMRSRTPAAAHGPQRLWAPWRMSFIEAPKPDGCIFCDYPAQEGEENDRKNLIVHRSPRSFTVLNRYPYNSGHVMVIPRVHVSRLEDLSREEWIDLHEELQRAAAAIRAAYRPEGMNVGMNLGRIAGAGIADHLHYHIVPRWGGDTNFMPVLGDVRVMVEHLDGTWERIRKGFAAS